MPEDALQKLMTWRTEQKLPTLHTLTETSSIKVGNCAYLPFAVDNENAPYYGKCICKVKEAARFHLLDCKVCSEVENEPVFIDIKIPKIKEQLIKIKHPQPPQPPAQNNEKLFKQTEERITKTIQRQHKKMQTDIKTMLANIKATNMSTDKTLGTILKHNLPLPATRVKVSKAANPTVECTIANVPYKEDENLSAVIEIIIDKKGLNTITTNDFHAFRTIKKHSKRKTTTHH
jgi:hypothetical protein